MAVREWQPSVGATVFIRSRDMNRRAAAGVIEQVQSLSRWDPESRFDRTWLLVRLITDYCETASDGTLLARTAAAETTIRIPSYRAEEAKA